MSCPTDQDLLARYARGEAGLAVAASVEQHVVRCAACRAALAAHVDRPALDAVWDRVRAVVDAPPRPFAQRVLQRLGVPEPDALLVAAVPALRTSWLLGVLAVLAFATAAAIWGGSGGLHLFLLVAPLAPVAGVVVSYGPAVDPTHELARAAPYPSARLLLLRLSSVLATSLPMALVGGLLLPDPAWLLAAWLLPAVAFTLVVLAAAQWVDPLVAGPALALAWTALVGAAGVRSSAVELVAPPVQPVYLALAAAAAVVLLSTLRSSDRPRRPA